MRHSVPRTHVIYTIAVIGFIYVLHMVVPMYSNSSFLSLFADSRTVGFIYMAGAALSVLGYMLIPYIIRRQGNYLTTIFLICIQIALFFGLISSTDPKTLSIIFIIQTAVVSLIGFCLDIFLEAYTDQGNIGATRGLFSATLNASWLIGPFIGSLIINGTENYRDTYVAALAMLFPLLYLVHRNFPRFHDPHYSHLSPLQAMRRIYAHKDHSRLFAASLILQTFYSWMVVYSPIYLHKNIGFNWDEIGIILVIMLLPFPLIQYKLGEWADKRYGEKEMMAIGLLIMGLSTITLSFFTLKNVALWAMLLFITRVGAAAAEIMIETYFFKTVPVKETAFLGTFRLTRPISYFLGPLIMMVGLLFLDVQYMFAVVGVFTLFGLYPALTIKDTR